MRTVKIFDTTLRDGEQSPGCSMNLGEKIEMARQLERLKVDIIEAGFAISSPEDFRSVKTIAETIKECTVASLARALTKDIDTAYDAVKNAADPRIHVFLATSPIHMKYKLKKTPEQVIEQAVEMVKYAKSLCPNIEFSAEDATRSDYDFLARITTEVIKAGANVVNLPDTVGYSSPQEMFKFITYIKENVPNVDEAVISTHVHDDLGLGVANSLAAVMAGAGQVECTINGIGERAGNAALEEIVMNLVTRKDLYNVECGIDTKQIYRTSKLLSSITGVPVQPNKAIVGANAFAHESGIHQHGVLANKETYEIMSPEIVGISTNKMVLGKHSGKHAFADRVKTLGYSIEEDKLEGIFAKFKELADKKKVVDDDDIEALLGIESSSKDGLYKYIELSSTSKSGEHSTATVVLEKDGERIEKTAEGDGPVDAAFKAVEEITGGKYPLHNFQIAAVTRGKDALGEVVVKIKSKGDTLITGKGLSTDIIESSVLAYVNAINKFEECPPSESRVSSLDFD